MEAQPRADAHRDDWDRHWEHFGQAASVNPAVSYRRRLITELLGTLSSTDRLLDIGSGQGELAIELKLAYPDAQVRGIEYALEGVRRSQEAAGQAGVAVSFAQRDLVAPATLDDTERRWATVAVCSEVLEHVDRPDLLLQRAGDYLGQGCRLVVTVPGGPRSAFDRHIGHRQHYTEAGLRALLEGADIEVQHVLRAGFPFFNLYKLATFARSKQLIHEFDEAAPDSKPSRLADGMLRFFGQAFELNLRDSRLGWQLVAVGRYQGAVPDHEV